jgi:acetoin utilization protein AcuC
MLHIIYHPKYLEYSFGPGHPFWPERAEVFLKLIKKDKIKYQIHEPIKATDHDVLLAHTPEYLERVKFFAKTSGALSIDTPLTNQVLEAAYFHSGGTFLACELAMQNKRVINLLGGLHHAGISASSGFCIFNDHAIAIKKLQKEKQIKKAFVFDVDVHAGQGTQEIFYTDPTVFTLSIHQDPTTLYPGTGFESEKGEGKGKGFNQNIILELGSGEKDFLSAVERGLTLQKNFHPDLTILIFGADTYKEDPLANIKLNLDTYKKLGKKMQSVANLCVLCAGGYSKKVPEIWMQLIQGLVRE